MIVAQPTWLVAALTLYSVINSLILTGLLFAVAKNYGIKPVDESDKNHAEASRLRRSVATPRRVAKEGCYQAPPKRGYAQASGGISHDTTVFKPSSASLRSGPKMPFGNVFKYIALKTVASICIVIAFFYFIAKMFCWTAWLMKCVECICLSTSLSSLSAQSISDQILFTFAVTVVQLCLLRIPPLMSRLTFCACVSASNIFSMLAIMLLALAWPL